MPIIIKSFIKAKTKLKARYATVVEIFDNQQRIIESGLAIFFTKPNSYTGEDILELQVHGNPILVQKIMETIVQLKNVRYANPGEFTKRAYLNKKIDIEQAKAVQRIIQARTETEIIANRRNLNGYHRKLVSELRSQMIQLKAESAAKIDLPEELDIKYAATKKAERERELQTLIHKISRIIEIAKNTKIMNKKFQICIIGRSNVGKSSLFNELLGNNRAIVSTEHGTTRDYVSEDLLLNNTLIRLYDTAGLRSSHEAVEKIEEKGIEYTKGLMRTSDLNIYVTSVDQMTIATEYHEIVESNKGKSIFVINKIDLLDEQLTNQNFFSKFSQKFPQVKKTIPISCHKTNGMDELKELIIKQLNLQQSNNEAIFLEEQQILALKKIITCLKAIELLLTEKAPEEIIMIELDNALHYLSFITEKIDDEEVLGRIFSIFCVGK